MSFSIEYAQVKDSRLFGLLDSVRSGNSWLWRTIVAMTIGSVFLFALQFVDARLFNGVSVWDKPAKFFLSLAVQYGTVSWALSTMATGPRPSVKVTGPKSMPAAGPFRSATGGASVTLMVTVAAALLPTTLVAT